MGFKIAFLEIKDLIERIVNSLSAHSRKCLAEIGETTKQKAECLKDQLQEEIKSKEERDTLQENISTVENEVKTMKKTSKKL